MFGRVGFVILAILPILGGVALVAISRDSLHETMFVELSDEGLTFHGRLHTLDGPWTPLDEGMVLYCSTNQLTWPAFIVVKCMGLLLLVSGVTLAAHQLPGLHDQQGIISTLPLASLKAAMAILFGFMGFRYFRRRREVADSLEVLRANPLGGLSDAGREVVTGWFQGEMLTSINEQIMSRALAAAVPVRTWSSVAAIAFLVIAASLLWGLVPR